MNTSLLNIDFVPLTEVKAKLSEKVARVGQENRLLAITLNGKPTVLMLPYAEFLKWVQKKEKGESGRTIDFKEWEKGSKQRREVSQSIKDLFDLSLLTRKGQKPYKRDALKKFKKV
ncbi:MAG: type II toxin-antitoxin system prevent-host-death family antitoxin [Deltaproteobacteria bacterium]|nr:type II toxin-antitoxin system prevent-host-death family antitoxin [Deltaproteobacteria bacterium]